MVLMSTPRTVDISITNQCNLRCLYCYHFSGPGDVRQELTTREWTTFIEEMGKNAVMRVILSGGEPFCRGDLRTILESIVRNRMRYSILTNGTLITDDTARFLASTRRCDTVQVSIDGASPGPHDYCRGKGNFEKAVAGIGHLQNNGVPVSVRVTVHKANLNDLENITEFLLEKLGLEEFSTNAASHFGLCRKNAAVVQLSAGDRMIAMERLSRLKKRFGGRITATAGPLADAEMWAAMERKRLANAAKEPGEGYLQGCNGIFENISVRSDGVFVPCTMLSHLELGRINRDRLIDVWQRHPRLKQLRERGSVPLTDFAYCQGCEYVRYCRGNCPALAYTYLGDDLRPSPDGCLRQFLIEGGRLPLQNQIPGRNQET